MITPLNTVFLSLDSTLQDEILLNGGLKLYLDPTYNLEHNATVTGKVAGIPKHPTGDCAEVCDKLKVGDEVAFSYRVVSDHCFSKAGDYFMPIMEDNPYQKKFVNSAGDRLMITAMPPVFGKFNKIWVGLLVDKKGNHLDGAQGNEAVVDEWLSHFKFSGVQDLAFTNLILSDKENLWRCQFTEILAKKKKDKVIAINDRIICEPIVEDVRHRIELKMGVALPYQSVNMEYIDRGKIVSGGIEMGFREGDIISFEPQYVEKYDLWGKQYFLIKKRRVQGRWQ